MEALFDLTTIYASGAIKLAATEFINTFRTNSSNIYAHHNFALSNEVRQTPEMQNFIKEVGARLNSELKITQGSIDAVNFIMEGNIGPKFSKPYKFKGLQILVIDTEHTLIDLLNYTFDSQTGAWEAVLFLNVMDHFGLDKRDALLYQGIVPFGHNGFAAWWRLQHMKGYVPFTTRMKIVTTISGNINN